jgi:hypothetical protein
VGEPGLASQAGGMVKSWANTYLAGAVSGTVLIVAAVVAFVPLVSLQALREWPISGLGIGVGSDMNGADEGEAVIGEDKPPAANLNAGPNAGPSVAANSATGARIGTTGMSSKRRHSGGTRGGEADGLADGAPAASPASAEGHGARNPGSHSPAGQSETVGSSGPAVRGERAQQGAPDKTPGSSPTTAKAVTRNPGSSPPADPSSAASASPQGSSASGSGSSVSETKGKSGQRHGTNRTAGPPPAPTVVVPRNPDPGQPGGPSAVRGRS